MDDPRATIYDRSGAPIGRARVVVKLEPGGRLWGAALLEEGTSLSTMSIRIAVLTSMADSSAKLEPGQTQVLQPDEAQQMFSQDLIVFDVVASGPELLLIQTPLWPVIN